MEGNICKISVKTVFKMGVQLLTKMSTEFRYQIKEYKREHLNKYLRIRAEIFTT